MQRLIAKREDREVPKRENGMIRAASEPFYDPPRCSFILASSKYMRSKVLAVWDQIRSSFWFVPLFLTIGVVIVGMILLRFDRSVWEFPAETRWVFGGSPEAARALLSVIAGSLITVVSVSFSITIVAIQQAATQYSPRVLRRFLQDRTNQWVLGIYVATFIYSLLVLREIRDQTSSTDGFVPALSVTLVLFLAIISIGMIVFFINHIVQSIQVSTMLTGIRREFKHELDRTFAKEVDCTGDGPSPALLPSGPEISIEAQREGYVRSIDVERLARITRAAWISAVVATRSVGDYVFPGMVLFRIYGDGDLTDDELELIRDTFVVNSSRSVRQDLLFAIRQIADVAIKALSPGINDPTTAEECITHLGGMVADLISRRLPPGRETIASKTYVFQRPDFNDYVRSSFSQIRQAARGKPHVLKTLVGTLAEVALIAKDPARLTPLRQEIEYVMADLKSGGMMDLDRAELQRLCQSKIAEMGAHDESLRKSA
ncbi:MAG TPA: DUF2254 domain-containing protein [Bdellovibrionota bacterium]|nr:DUF2254 domain-containing protein [Bdellovibrionota bacterium]